MLQVWRRASLHSVSEGTTRACFQSGRHRITVHHRGWPLMPQPQCLLDEQHHALDHATKAGKTLMSQPHPHLLNREPAVLVGRNLLVLRLRVREALAWQQQQKPYKGGSVQLLGSQPDQRAAATQAVATDSAAGACCVGASPARLPVSQGRRAATCSDHGTHAHPRTACLDVLS